MADGGVGNSSPASLFQARLDTSDGVSDTLTLLPYAGNKVAVAGQTVVVPGTGLTRDIADDLIDSTGADSGGPPAASTLYYVYVSNQKASFSPSSIRLSATSPTLVNGVRYLGASGNALNWRFVGWVAPNATPKFESSEQNRWIVNYYNRRPASLFHCPGYSDGSGSVNWSLDAAGFVELNGGTGSRVNFISNGEDAFSVRYVLSYLGGTTVYLGIGVDVVNQPDQLAYMQIQAGSETTDASKKLPEGLRFLAMLATNASGGAVNVQLQQAAAAFPGATNDIPTSYIRGTVQV